MSHPVYIFDPKNWGAMPVWLAAALGLAFFVLLMLWALIPLMLLSADRQLRAIRAELAKLNGNAARREAAQRGRELARVE